MNFNNVNQILMNCAKQFIKDEFRYYTQKYDNFYHIKNLTSREIEEIEVQSFDMYQEIESKIELPFYCELILQSIVNSHTSTLIVNNKYYTNKLLFVTFRPPEEMEINTFKDIISKLIEKDIIRSYIIVFEQKGNSYSTLGQGKHIHGLIQFNFKCQFKTYKQMLKKFFDKKGIYDLQDINKKEFIIDKLVYMGLLLDEDNNLKLNESLNYKTGEGKNECLKYDRLFQQRNNLSYITKDSYSIIKMI